MPFTGWVRVKATREGLTGTRTATGWRINSDVPFVALPSDAARYRTVALRNPLTGQTTRAIVLDVGPWFTDDEAYVFGSARPKAERAVSLSRRVTNGAGIDLGERVWTALGLVDNTDVEWTFDG